MDRLSKKSLTVSRGYTYTYYTHPGHPARNPNTDEPKPTLVLCHGWPDTAALYAGLLPSLLELGHPLILPDGLGFGGTSKPTDEGEYALMRMAGDVWEVLEREGVGKVVIGGHDWGSALAQRIYLRHPSRCVGLILLSVAYLPPSPAPFDLTAFNKLTDQAFGYPAYAYWDVFAADDGPEILRQNVETLFHAIHWDHPDAMRTFFATSGNTRKLLTTTGPEAYPLKPYAQAPGFKEAFLERMRRDGFEGPQCWYKAAARNVNYAHEKDFPQERMKIEVPCLYIGATEDTVCRTDQMGRVRELVPDVTEFAVEANHWLTYEKPEEVGGLIAGWLKERY